MKSFFIKINLADALILSENTATVGNRLCLDYIPGSSLLGALAAKLSPTLTSKEIWDLFFSGKFRFGNAYFSVGSELSLPMPLSLHYKKGDDYQRNNRLLSENLINLSMIDAVSFNIPLRQMRRGYLSSSGNLFRPRKKQVIKASPNNDNNESDKQIFTYQALIAGQTFTANLDVDDGVDNELLDKLIESMNGVMRLGRSKSAEFGRVDITIEESAPSVITGYDGKVLPLWLKSDLALYDEYGQPSFEVNAGALGLRQARLLPERSFIRTRLYSPYNAYRNSYDQQRQVISQGSVLTLELLSPLTPDDCITLRQGLGAYTSAGLGQIEIAPSILMTEHPQFDSSPDNLTVTSINSPRPDTPLINWLFKEEVQASKNVQATYDSQVMVDKVIKHYASARQYAGVLPEVSLGPGKEQWYQMLDAAKAAANTDDLLRRLEDIYMMDSQYWGMEVPQQDSWQAIGFGQWLLKELEKMDQDNRIKLCSDLPRLMIMLDTEALQKGKPQEEVT